LEHGARHIPDSAKKRVEKDRASWISDVRKSLEKHLIGWTMWDYIGGFGVVTKPNGQPVVDKVTVKTLGRTVPRY
jgi:endoglucanase